MKTTINARYGEDALLVSFKGGQRLTLELSEDFRPYFDEYVGKDITVDIKPKTNNRSLNANAFMWATLSDISSVTKVPAKDIYRRLIPDVGGNYTVLRVNASAAEQFHKVWQSHGIGWVCEVMNRGEKTTDLICYYGSSVYDRTQMSRLIDLVLQEARQQGIKPRLTQAEIQAVIDRWGKEAMKNSNG